MCLDNGGKDDCLPIDQVMEAVTVPSVNSSTDSREMVTDSDKCQAEQQLLPATNSDDMSALSQCKSGQATTNASAFYFRPGSDCYESFADIVTNANRTSQSAAS